MDDGQHILSRTPQMVGDSLLLNRTLKAFLCSGGKFPDEVFASVRRWVRSLDRERDCVLVGNLLGLERFVIRLLLEQKVPLAIVFAEALPSDMNELAMMLHDFPIKEALEANRLLVLSVNDDAEDCAATGMNARMRNLWMLGRAQQTVVGFLRPGGKLFQQVRGRRNVLVLK